MPAPRRSVLVRAIGVLVVGALSFGALAAGPASAGKFLTKKRAMRLFVTKKEAARFVAGPLQYVRSDPATIQSSGPDAHVFKGVLCPAGTTVIGGGGVSSAVNMAMEQSFPWGGDPAGVTAGSAGWGVRYDNDTTAPQTFRAYAICAAAPIAGNFAAGSPAA